MDIDMRFVRQGTTAYLRFCQKRGGVCSKENKSFQKIINLIVNNKNL